MKRIDTITLQEMLPRVFRGSETEPPVSESEVWMHKLVFKRPGRYLIEAESGAGKSSLCSYIYGLRDDYDGHLLLNDEDARSLDNRGRAEMRRQSLARLPQEINLFGELTARENVELKNRLTNCKTPHEIEEMFELLGITDRIDRPASTLSVGQQQRVGIIRALCQPFDFILLDEPVSHLDERSNRSVAALIERELTTREAGVIVTSVGNPLLLENMQRIRL